MKKFILVLTICLIPYFCFAEQTALDTKLDEIYKKAEQAIDKGDIKTADFWLARYMGLTAFNEKVEKNYTDVYPLLNKRAESLAPTSFISGYYDEEFLDFFVRGSYRPWGIDEKGIDERSHSFEIASASNGKYFASIIASPWLEGWYIVGDKPRNAVLCLGENVQIISGKLENNKPIKRYEKINLAIGEHPLHFVWPAEFYDLDNDSIPEIWIRYIATLGNGFSQMLDIYKIKDDTQLILLKKFEGLAEGIARRLPDGSIEVGEGFGEGGHMGYDKYRIETWQYKNGELRKTGERVIPHILLSEEWGKYYFE